MDRSGKVSAFILSAPALWVAASRPRFPVEPLLSPLNSLREGPVIADRTSLPWQDQLPMWRHREWWLLPNASVLEYCDCGSERLVMEKWMCYGALGVAGLMCLLFLLDLVIGRPFGGDAFQMADIFGLLA